MKFQIASDPDRGSRHQSAVSCGGPKHLGRRERNERGRGFVRAAGLPGRQGSNGSGVDGATASLLIDDGRLVDHDKGSYVARVDLHCGEQRLGSVDIRFSPWSTPTWVHRAWSASSSPGRRIETDIPNQTGPGYDSNPLSPVISFAYPEEHCHRANENLVRHCLSPRRFQQGHLIGLDRVDLFSPAERSSGPGVRGRGHARCQSRPTSRWCMPSHNFQAFPGRRARRAVAVQLSDGSGLRADPLLAMRFGGGALRAIGRSRQLFGEGESPLAGALLYLNGSPQVPGSLADAVEFKTRDPLLALTLILENLQIAISPSGRKSRKQIRFCRRGTNVTVAASPFYSATCPS